MARYVRFRDFDWILLIFVLIICALGITEIYSATRNTKFDDANLEVERDMRRGSRPRYGERRRRESDKQELSYQRTHRSPSRCGRAGCARAQEAREHAAEEGRTATSAETRRPTALTLQANTKHQR